MNNNIQVNDLVESLKAMIADLSYKVAYRDAVIAAYERQISELNDLLLEYETNKTGANNNDIR